MALGFRDWTRDDPVADAYDYYARDMNRPVVGKCCECGYEIYGEDDYYEEDDAYLFEDGDLVCHDCLVDYCRKHFKI